jgi:hypothetical protein
VQPSSIVEMCSDLESGHRRLRSPSVCDRHRGGFGSSLSRVAVVGSQRSVICAALGSRAVKNDLPEAG